jgi:tetratricopeptide (TPR) repeat protein
MVAVVVFTLLLLAHAGCTLTRLGKSCDAIDIFFTAIRRSLEGVRMNRSSLSSVLALSLVFLTSSVLRAQTLDLVVPVAGPQLSGTVVAATPTQITVEVRGQQRMVAVNEIRRVTFGDDPQELKRARDNAYSGNFEGALNELKTLNPASITRDFVKQDFAFYLAYSKGKVALAGGGDKAAAANELLAFVTANKQTYHLYAAAELLGDLAVAQENYAQAVRYYGSLAKSPFPEYQLKGGVLEGRALVAEGKFAEAIAKFDAVVAGSIDTPAATQQKRLAEVGKALCLAETGQVPTAIQMLQKIIQENDAADGELFGRAYNALGRCYLKTDKKKDALLAYLHTDILFYANPDAHAEALYYLSSLWNEANKADRAIASRNLLTQRYAGSSWAKKQ